MRTGLKDLEAALALVALKQPKLPNAALPQGLLSPAENASSGGLGIYVIAKKPSFKIPQSHIVHAFPHMTATRICCSQKQQPLFIHCTNWRFIQQLTPEVRISIAFWAATAFFFYRMRRPENRGTFCIISRY